MAVVVAGREQLGALVLRPDTELDDAERRILERAPWWTALLILFQRSTADAAAKIGADLLADLLLALDRDPATLRERAHRLGLNLDNPSVVVVLSRQERDNAPARLAARRNGLHTRNDGKDALLLPGIDAAETTRSVATDLPDTTAGAAGPCKAKIGSLLAYDPTGVPISSAPSRRISGPAAARPTPRRPCTFTPTRSTSDWSASANC